MLLPERVAKLGWVNAGVEFALKRPYEKLFASIYNNSDGLVVLSEGLRSYWRERGVTAPIHVIPRAVQPEIFDKPLGEDPYTHLTSDDPRAGDSAWRGARLLCAGRHTREKAQDRIIRIFARHVAPVDREATLTLLGDGPDRSYYERVAKEEGVEHRVFFPGEVPFTKMPDYYAYADVFVHGSLSETYGNVLGEALWCGTPTVAFADGMGVSAQIKDRVNGVLLSPGNDSDGESESDAAFGRAVARSPRRSSGARPRRHGRLEDLARAQLAPRRAAAHRGRVPPRAGARGHVRHPPRDGRPARPPVDDHAQALPHLVDGQRRRLHRRLPPPRRGEEAQEQLHPQIGK